MSSPTVPSSDPSPTRATVVAPQPDGSVLVVLDDGSRRSLPPRAASGFRRLAPGQRLVLTDGIATIGGPALLEGR